MFDMKIKSYYDRVWDDWAKIIPAPERDWIQPKLGSRPKRRKNMLKVRRATKQRHKRGA